MDTDGNDYLTSKWLGLIRPLLAGFDRPLTSILPQATVTMILEASAPPLPCSSSEDLSRSSEPDVSSRLPREQESLDSREDIRRRSEAPYEFHWRHGGINE